MRKILPVTIILITASLLFTGCSNIFGNNEKETSATTASTTTTTTAQIDTSLVTLATETSTVEKEKEFVYHSDIAGASFTIPSQWENKYVVLDNIANDGSKYVSFYEKENYSYKENGLIFTYNLFVNDNYKKRASYTEYGTATDSEGNTYYLVCTTPGGIQYDKDKAGLVKAYNNLNKESYITSICKSVIFDINYTVDKNGCSTTPSTTEGSSSEGTSTAVDGSSPSRENTTKANAENRNSSNEGLVFADISTRKLTDAEIKALSKDKIQDAINDICALHGYNFNTKSIKEHYESFDWYKPSSDFSESSFNSVEKYNYDLLQKYR